MFENSRLGRRCGCGGVGDSSFARVSSWYLTAFWNSMMDFRYWGFKIEAQESGTSSIIAWIVSESV